MLVNGMLLGLNATLPIRFIALTTVLLTGAARLLFKTTTLVLAQSLLFPLYFLLFLRFLRFISFFSFYLISSFLNYCAGLLFEHCVGTPVYLFVDLRVVTWRFFRKN
jgi:hypothetical protein